jgi:hypothetical protein
MWESITYDANENFDYKFVITSTEKIFIGTKKEE